MGGQGLRGAPPEEPLDILAEEAIEVLRLQFAERRAQAPQLPDVYDGGAWRAPGGADAAAARAAHARFWRAVWAARAADGAAETTATIEFGPPPYTQVDLDGAPLVPLERAVDDAAAWLRGEFDAWHRETTKARL